MRNIFYLAALLAAPFFFGCASTDIMCDLRGQSEVCEIHHTVMETQVVKRKNLPMPSRAYVMARSRYFRHSIPFMLPEQCKTSLVYICPECVSAEREWLNDNPGEKP